MGCPFLRQQQQPKIERPRDVPYESLYRPWSWMLSSFLNLFIFILLALILLVLYKRRLSSSRLCGPRVSYRKVDVLKADGSKSGKIRAVVTGGNGGTGSAIVKRLVEDGAYEVHSLDLSIPDEEDRDPRVSSYIQTDITSLEDLEIALKGAAVVFHAASVSANLHTAGSSILNANTTGTERVIAACKRCGVNRLIYTSSALATLRGRGCFSDPAGTTPANTECPLNPYSASVAFAERLVCAANGTGGLVTCALRPAMILGTRDPFTLACLTQRMYYCGAGDECWQMAPVASCAQAHLLAEKQLLKGGKSATVAGKAYFISGVRVPLRDLFGKMEKDGETTLWGQPPPQSYSRWRVQLLAYLNVAVHTVLGVNLMGSDFVPANISMLVDQNCDCTPACKELGWKMDFPPWEEMVRGVVKEYRQLVEEKKDV